MTEEEKAGVAAVIFEGLTGGVGPWGAFRPLAALFLALVPFLFLGQHFNGNHKRGLDFTMLQIPLLLSLILYPILYLWSIFDAYQTAILRAANRFQD